MGVLGLSEWGGELNRWGQFPDSGGGVGFGGLCEARSLTRKENIMKFLGIMSNAIFLKRV